MKSKMLKLDVLKAKVAKFLKKIPTPVWIVAGTAAIAVLLRLLVR